MPARVSRSLTVKQPACWHWAVVATAAVATVAGQLSVMERVCAATSAAVNKVRWGVAVVQRAAAAVSRQDRPAHATAVETLLDTA